MNTKSTSQPNKSTMKTLVSFKIDKNVKKEAVKICDEIGIPFSTFLNITVKNLIRTKRFVGEISYLPNEMTVKSMNEGDKDY